MGELQDLLQDLNGLSPDEVKTRLNVALTVLGLFPSLLIKRIPAGPLRDAAMQDKAATVAYVRRVVEALLSDPALFAAGLKQYGHTL